MLQVMVSKMINLVINYPPPGEEKQNCDVLTVAT